MYTIDDLKTNRDAQIMVGCIVFFILAFPAYFALAADGADGSLGGGVGDYQVNGEISYIPLADGSVYVDDATTWSEVFNTDAVDGAEDLNIVGVMVSMSYGEDEESSGAGCGDDGPDTITGTATHLEYSGSEDGQNSGGSGAHDAMAIWYNDTMVGSVVSGLSMSEIDAELDKTGAGAGDHTVDISVFVDTGNTNPAPFVGCQRTDNGEQVDYTVQLMVLEYTIAPFMDTSDL